MCSLPGLLWAAVPAMVHPTCDLSSSPRNLKSHRSLADLLQQPPNGGYYAPQGFQPQPGYGAPGAPGGYGQALYGDPQFQQQQFAQPQFQPQPQYGGYPAQPAPVQQPPPQQQQQNDGCCDGCCGNMCNACVSGAAFGCCSAMASQMCNACCNSIC